MQISANGNSNGILWALQTGAAGARGSSMPTMRPISSNELYNSNQAGPGISSDEWDKFSVPVSQR